MLNAEIIDNIATLNTVLANNNASAVLKDLIEKKLTELIKAIKI